MPGKTVVVTDSTACLTEEEIRQNPSIASVVPLRVIFDEEVVEDGDLSEVEFFERLKSANSTTTSAPDVISFQTAYEKAIRSGATDIISVHLTHKLSGTHDSANSAALILHDEFPNVRIHQWNSKFVSMALGCQALLASEMAESGAEIGEILPALEDLRSRTKLMVALDTLEYVRRGGRIGRARAFLGAALKVKPILAVENEEVVPVERPRTTRKAYARLVELVKGWGPLDKLVVSSGLAFEGALDVTKLLIDSGVYTGPIFYAQIASTLAVHAGPGVVGVVGVQKKE
jgi:DegV family protein with EDD domain